MILLTVKNKPRGTERNINRRPLKRMRAGHRCYPEYLHR